ncbi:MAG: FAD:protein FMN transferase [Candidatus Nanopelagicales bacterium]
MRTAFPVMGTVASIAVSPADVERLGRARITDAVIDARSVLETLDQRFSHYSVNSDISRWLAGGPVSPEAVADFSMVLRQCGRLKADSGGVFTIKNRATGTVDTAGYVKGFAIGRAVESLRRAGLANAVVGVGGDTYSMGRASASRPWRVAVAHPQARSAVAAIVEATDLAVATSGTAQRGQHIWNGSRRPVGALLSFTVIGPGIADADAFATIGFAMGEPGIAWVASHDGYRSVVIRRDGTVLSDAALLSAA